MRVLALTTVFSAATSVSGASGLASTADRVPAAVVPCDQTIGSEESVGPDRIVARDRVALPASALQANEFPDAKPAERYFAKVGLLVRPGARAEIVVPRKFRGTLRVGWGSPPKTTHLVRVKPCGPERDTFDDYDQWDVYAGGFWVRRPACVAVVVRAAGASERVSIGVGAPCPGQSPPAPGV